MPAQRPDQRGGVIERYPDVPWHGLHLLAGRGEIRHERDHGSMVGGHRGEFVLRERRLLSPGPHVGPDDSVALATGIGHGPDLVLEIALGRLVWHIDAAAQDRSEERRVGKE